LAFEADAAFGIWPSLALASILSILTFELA